MKRPPLNAFPMYSLLGAYYTKNAPGRRHLVGLTTAPRPFVRLALRTIRWTAGQARFWYNMPQGGYTSEKHSKEAVSSQ